MDSKTKTPASGRKKRKSGVVTPKMATPVAREVVNTGNKSAKKRKKVENQAEESAANSKVLSSQLLKNGHVATTPKAGAGEIQKKKRTPRSSRKRGKKDESKAAEDDLVEEEDHDDSLVISFPKIQTSTPKVATLDTTEDLEGAQPRPETAKSKTRKRKSTGKRAAEPSVGASPALEKENVRASLRKRKIATVTVEEGSVEVKETKKQSAKNTVVKSNLDSKEKKESVTETKTNDEEKTRKRSAAKKTEKSSGSKKQKLDNKYHVYCGNLPKGISKETLYYFISENNVFPEIRLVKTQKKSPKNKNMKRMRVHHAILTCNSWEDAESIVSLNQISMPSPTVKEEKKLQIRHIRKNEINDCKLYLGNLAQDTEESHIETFFKGHDLCPDKVVVMRSKKKQICKGFGFVWFPSSSEAESAVKLNGSTINNQAVRIEHLKKKDHETDF